MTKTKTEMKRIAVILFLLFAFFSLSACEPGNESSYKPLQQPGTSGESTGRTQRAVARCTGPLSGGVLFAVREYGTSDRTDPDNAAL